MVIKELCGRDFLNGFLDTLANLSPPPTGNVAQEVFRKIQTHPEIVILVAEEDDGTIVGALTVLIEQKFIHGGGLVAHVEDVATRSGFERRGIFRRLMAEAEARARRAGCYKSILHCREEFVPLYERVGYRRVGVEMRLDLV